MLDIKSGVEGVSWPPVAIGGASVLAGVINQLEISQWLPAEILEKRQFEQLTKLVTYSQKHSPHFANRLKKAGLSVNGILTPDWLRKLPVLTRSDVQQAGTDLNNAQVPKSHLPFWEVKTSGSTGQPVVANKTAMNHLMWQANMMREHIWHKRDFKGRIMNIRGSIKEEIKQQNWGDPVNMLFESGEVLGLPATLSVKEQIKVMHSFKPNNLIIYPNTLEAIVSLCENENVLVPQIDHIWSIGETLSVELREKATKIFKASVEDDYSTNELGILALQCPETGLYHIMSESVIIEILDDNDKPCKEGEMGRVIITNLHNFATPLIRYEIGDYAELGGKCKCGRGLPTIKSIKGRKRNLVLKPDGSRHWPPLTVAIFQSKLPILQFQLIQHSFEDVEVRLVVKTKLSEDDEKHLAEKLHIALSHPFNLNFVYFDERIPIPVSGKFEDYICKL